MYIRYSKHGTWSISNAPGRLHQFALDEFVTSKDEATNLTVLPAVELTEEETVARSEAFEHLV